MTTFSSSFALLFLFSISFPFSINSLVCVCVCVCVLLQGLQLLFSFLSFLLFSFAIFIIFSSYIFMYPETILSFIVFKVNHTNPFKKNAGTRTFLKLIYLTQKETSPMRHFYCYFSILVCAVCFGV